MERVFQAKEKERKGPEQKLSKTTKCSEEKVVEEPAQAVPEDAVIPAESTQQMGDLLEAILGAPEADNNTLHTEGNPTIEDYEDTSCLSNDIVLFQPLPDNVSREGRNMLLHFSEHIATEMIAFDGFHNGWRHLILPLAQTDHIVLNAVLAAAEAHQRINQAQAPINGLQDKRLTLWHPNSSRLYARAIQGLRERQELIHGDQASKLSVITTILVLLSAVLVTGCSDFPVLIRMLESAIEAMGGREGLGDGEFTDFILRQVNKMRVYAAPLLCEQTGVQIISSRAQTAQLLDCLNHSVQQYPEQAVVSKQVTDLVDQARDIYLNQVFSELESSSSLGTSDIGSIRRVQRFKQTLQALPPDSPAHKVLVWATFVAASDCQLEEHKAFFEGVLMRHFARSGFGNVLKGLESLQRIWARDPRERWTSMLPEGKVLVM